MPSPNFSAVAADIRDFDAVDHRARAARAAELKRLAACTKASWRAEQAASLIRESGQLFEGEIIVLLQAVAEAICRDNMHIEERRDLVDELHLLIEVQQEQIEAEAAFEGVES